MFGIEQQQISIGRRTAVVFIVIDKSYSMQGNRMTEAKKGAAKLVASLHASDKVAVLAFSDGVDDVSGGIVRCSDAGKQDLTSKIERIQPNGQTALYDSVLAACQLVLQCAATDKLLSQATGQEVDSYHLVVLTDGDDTKSTSTQGEAERILRRVGGELGELIKMSFIGVQLGDGPKRKLQALVNAAGSIGKFTDARSVDDISASFDEIVLTVRRRRTEVGGLAGLLLGALAEAAGEGCGVDDSQPLWPGEIQCGSHVRCVGASCGAGKVEIGDVGVVKGRSHDGRLNVNFPAQDGWWGEPGSDLVLDTDADKIRPSALVQVKPTLSRPKFDWGMLEGMGKHTVRGMVVEVSHDGKVNVDFGFSGVWKGLLSELVCIAPEHITKEVLQIGDAVRVPAGTTPSTGWGSPSPQGEVGYVTQRRHDGNYVINFPSKDGWLGRPKDVEIDQIANVVRPGKEVKLRTGGGSIGKVLSIGRDGRNVRVRGADGTVTQIGLVSAVELLSASVEVLGWSVGDECVSVIEYLPSSLFYGDKGKVVGSADDCKTADASERVLVDFGPSKGRVNLNAKTQIVTVGEFDQRQKQKKVDQEKAARDKAAADKAAAAEAARDKAARDKAARDKAARDKAAAEKAARDKAARDSAACDKAAAEKAAAVDKTQECTALQKAKIDKAEKPRGIFGSCLRSATAAAIDNDTLVRLKGLSETGLNGQLARVKGFSPRSSRYEVEVNGSVYAIKPEKIEKVEVMEQD